MGGETDTPVKVLEDETPTDPSSDTGKPDLSRYTSRWPTKEEAERQKFIARKIRIAILTGRSLPNNILGPGESIVGYQDGVAWIQSPNPDKTQRSIPIMNLPNKKVT